MWNPEVKYKWNPLDYFNNDSEEEEEEEEEEEMELHFLINQRFLISYGIWKLKRGGISEDYLNNNPEEEEKEEELIFL